MKKKLLLFSIIALFTYLNKSLAQDALPEETKKEEKAVLPHTVELGETVMIISKKYLVRPTDIYDINPGAVHGIYQNMVLKIPADKIKKKLNNEQRGKIRKEWVPVKEEY